MPSLKTSLIILASATFALARRTLNCAPFPDSLIQFSADFQQPKPPVVEPEFQANSNCGLRNLNLSHITNGYIVNSPSKRYVRADEANEAGLQSSYFNYANVTKDALVDNILTSYSPNSIKPDVWRGYVNSNFPIFEKTILVDAGAVFSGLVRRDFVVDSVAAWSIMYQGVIPVTVFVNNCNVIVGYDYFSVDLRTRVITEFFNIQIGA